MQFFKGWKSHLYNVLPSSYVHHVINIAICKSFTLIQRNCIFYFTWLYIRHVDELHNSYHLPSLVGYVECQMDPIVQPITHL